jgi:hypothetical protein
MASAVNASVSTRVSLVDLETRSAITLMILIDHWYGGQGGFFHLFHERCHQCHVS